MNATENSTTIQSVPNRLKASALLGLKIGLKTWWWLIKITVSVTFLIALLQWAGVINWLGGVLAPIFEPFGLSAGGVMVFITTAVANIYAGLGAIATLSVEYREVLILGAMGLICHNMIMETIIQKKSGANPIAMIVLRIVAALFIAIVLNLIMPANLSGNLVLDSVNTGQSQSFWSVMEGWGLNMLNLLPFMLGMVLGLNILQKVLAEFGILQLISKPFVPIMKLFGLKPKSSIIWLILNTLGLAYGGAVMIGERESGELDLRESKLLNTHIAMSHSLLEDSLLYLAIGVPVLIVFVPRIVLAIVCVWGQRVYYRVKKI